MFNFFTKARDKGEFILILAAMIGFEMSGTATEAEIGEGLDLLLANYRALPEVAQ